MKKILSSVLAMLLVACATILLSGAAQAQTPGLPPAMQDVPWTLTAIHPAGQAVQPINGASIILQFGADGQAGGTSTCNSYGGPYQAGANQALTLGPLISTKRACVDQSLMALESTYFQALGGATAYDLTGDRLRLFYDHGQSVLEFSTTSPPGMPSTGAGAGGVAPWVALLVSLLLVAGGLILRAVRAPWAGGPCSDNRS
jgi:heat shock protein HslJ